MIPTLPWSAMDTTLVGIFGQPVIYITRDSTQWLINGIESTSQLLEDPIAKPYAHLFVRQADLPPNAAEGDTIQFDNKSYSVIRMEEDAIGGVKLILNFNNKIDPSLP